MTLPLRRSLPRASRRLSLSTAGSSSSNVRLRDLTQSLPGDVLERILIYAVRHRPPTPDLAERQWMTCADLRAAQNVIRVSRAWRDAFYAIVTRFSFFAVGTHIPSPAPPALLRTLSHCPQLRALQLVLHARDAPATPAALCDFLNNSARNVTTIHLCCPSFSTRQPRLASIRVRDTLESVAEGCEERLRALSLDCCGTLSERAIVKVAELSPFLARLAFDFTYISNWSLLKSFRNLRELRLQNCELTDASMRQVLNCVPHLEMLAVAYQGPRLTAAGLQGLPELRRLSEIELCKCEGLADEAVVALGEVQTLHTVRLLHVEVKSSTLESLVQRMGARLRGLRVTSFWSTGFVVTQKDAVDGAVEAVLRAVRKYCPNVQSVDFAQDTPHWSDRPYAEALRFIPRTYTETPRLEKTVVVRGGRWRAFLAGLCVGPRPQGAAVHAM